MGVHQDVTREMMEEELRSIRSEAWRMNFVLRVIRRFIGKIEKTAATREILKLVLEGLGEDTADPAGK